ncbi:MAG: hypothetical protein WDO18_19480 [Acidobacteriota bacterium]
MKIALTALCLGLSAVSFAQEFDTFRARINQTSGDRGKCTIEVVVDGAVEVEIFQDQARLRTLSGARGNWRRMDCNMALPQNPADFKFSGRDGRGTQTLVRGPLENRGVAVVRIEDTEGGSEGYKFDIEWRGVTGGLNGGGLSGGGITPGPAPSTGGSIFDRPAGGGGVIDNGSFAGWNERVDFKGRGDGYYQSFHGPDEILSDCQVLIERSGRVEVRLSTGTRDSILLSGRLIMANRGKLVANMTGGSISGTMEILVERNRVKELAMTGVGRNRFELRWQIK